MRLAEQITGKGTRNKKWTPAAWYKKASEAYMAFINEQEQ